MFAGKMREKGCLMSGAAARTGDLKEIEEMHIEKKRKVTRGNKNHKHVIRDNRLEDWLIEDVLNKKTIGMSDMLIKIYNKNIQEFIKKLFIKEL